MNRQLLWIFVMVLIVFSFGHNVFGQSIMVGPDGKFEKSVLNLPFAFYNENFGFAGAYVYAVTGYPQKQASLISTAMAGTNGSAMAFLIGRDLQRVTSFFLQDGSLYLELPYDSGTMKFRPEP